jgi:prolyl 4-hydroxylase
MKPRLGDAVLFYGALPDLTIDQQALHASCPVLHGVKWTAVRWLHEKPWQDRIDDNVVDI